ncbi:unnamed protein product [Ilex paraguariensis]|uniref:Uncharacterized protein n=1 Tax=Ilex paraguariensis TaxID=185542 RepID=A0ABC8TEM1_9AQUA
MVVPKACKNGAIFFWHHKHLHPPRKTYGVLSFADLDSHTDLKHWSLSPLPVPLSLICLVVLQAINKSKAPPGDTL